MELSVQGKLNVCIKHHLPVYFFGDRRQEKRSQTVLEDVHTGGIQETNVFNISIIVCSFIMGLIGKIKT